MIAVYKDNSLLKNGVDKHYTVSTPAKLVVHGALNVEALGGTVTIGEDGASLNITQANSVSSKEIKALQTGKTLTISVSALGQTVSADLPYSAVTYGSATDTTLYATGNTTAGNNQRMSAMHYIARGGKWNEVMVVTYQTNGGVLEHYTQDIITQMTVRRLRFLCMDIRAIPSVQ